MNGISASSCGDNSLRYLRAVQHKSCKQAYQIRLRQLTPESPFCMYCVVTTLRYVTRAAGVLQRPSDVVRRNGVPPVEHCYRLLEHSQNRQAVIRSRW